MLSVLWRKFRRKPFSEHEIYPYQVTETLGERLLVLAPHPDDESIGCGGTILKHTRRGGYVRVIFVTDGGRGDFEGRFGDDYTSQRRASALQAMNILGVKDHRFWDYRDRELSRHERTLSKRILTEANEFSPDTLLVPSAWEVHPDHKAIFRAVWRIRRSLMCQIVLYEVLVPLYPNILIDITDEIDEKKRAIDAYYTETAYTNYTEKVSGLNIFRSTTLKKDVRYAEAFLRVKPLDEISRMVLPLLLVFA